MISNACWRKVCFQEVSLPKQKQHGAINDCKFQWKIIVRGRAKTMNWNSPPRGEADTYAASVCECAWKSATCERLWSKITSNKTIPSYTYFREYSTYKTVDKMCKNTKKTQEKTRNKQNHLWFPWENRCVFLSFSNWCGVSQGDVVVRNICQKWMDLNGFD